MRILYFDCFSGASGDMILGAMLDAGFSLDALRAGIGCLGLAGIDISCERVNRLGLAAARVRVSCPREKTHRHLNQVRDILHGGGLPGAVAGQADRIFTRLAEAEAGVHGTSIEQVHFHEVGAADAIVDIVGACLGFAALAVDRAVCSPVPVGSGTVECEHGVLPVPAPATLALLKGVPLAECDEPGELTTPTGAAIVTELAENFGPLPAMKVTEIGCGAGDRQGRRRPNVLRLIVGEMLEPGTTDEVITLQANLDDATGEVIGHVTDRLFEAGAIEVFTTPVGMKKGRPGVLITVLTDPAKAEPIEQTLFAETPTFGVRRWTVRRSKLERRFETVRTPWGAVRVKLGLQSGRCLSATPEFDDCRRLATEHRVPVREVLARASELAAAFVPNPPAG